MSDDEVIEAGLFEEPKDFYRPPDPPTFETYTRDSKYIRTGEPTEIKVRLVGKSPLWGHLLWNAGLVTTDFIDQNRNKHVDGKRVLELGAAAALPALNALLTAHTVVITDYPDLDLLENIKINCDMLVESVKPPAKVAKYAIEGFIWGNPVDDLLKANDGQRFDLIILSDLIFNHSEHEKLLRSCKSLLAETGIMLVVFTHHRPSLAHRDDQFFIDAETDWQMKCTKIIEKKMSPMFEKDQGDPLVRSMVYGYIVQHAPLS